VTSAELLEDGFGRIREEVHHVLDGLTDEELAFRVDADANSIGWLIWHLTRAQDDHIAAAAGLDQVWLSEWEKQCGLPFEPEATGYGHSSAEVAAVRVPGRLLAGYHDATYAQTIDFVRGLRDADLDQVVDRFWNPPVTLGVRLVSVLSDDLQHVGQAAFVRGLIERR
jgi:hypothetical protein